MCCPGDAAPAAAAVFLAAALGDPDAAETPTLARSLVDERRGNLRARLPQHVGQLAGAPFVVLREEGVREAGLARAATSVAIRSGALPLLN